MYQKRFKEGILSDPRIISLTWNTDCVPLFKSSFVLWPLYFIINEQQQQQLQSLLRLPTSQSCGFQTEPLKLQTTQGKLTTIDVYLHNYNICMPKKVRKAKIQNIDEMHLLNK